MARRIISFILMLSMVFQGTYTLWRTAASLGALMVWSSYSLAEYNPALPPTITPAPDTGPFNAHSEGVTVGISGRNYGLGTASSDGNTLYLPDGQGGMETFDNSKMLGSYQDGASFNVTDLKNGYGNQGAINALTTTQQAQFEADPESTITGFVYDQNQTQAQNKVYHDMRKDPIIEQSSLLIRSLSDESSTVFDDIFTDCTAINIGGVNPNGNDFKHCYRPAGEIPATCSMANQVTIIPNAGPTVVGMIIDDSGSMGSGPGSRLEHAKSAAQVIANALDQAVDTELYARSFNSNPVQDFPQTVSDALYAYNAITSSGGTPIGATLKSVMKELNTRPEPNKVIIVITDGEPTDPDLVHEFIASHPDVTFYAIGIELSSVATYAWNGFEIISSPADIDVAAFNLLSKSYTLSNTWYPPECAHIQNLIEAGVVTASASCTTAPNANGCVFIDTLWVCPSTAWAAQLTPPPFPTVPALCGALTVSGISYSHSLCWTDPNGVEHCVGDPSTSTCGPWENNPSYGIYTSACVPGAVDPVTDQCLLFGQTYIGGYGVPTGVSNGPTTYTCPGPVHCVDGSCANNPEEINPNFPQAAAALQMAMQSAIDHECDPTIAGACEIFKGDVMECHIDGVESVGIIALDCCEDAASVSLADYLTMAHFIYKQEKTQAMLTQLKSYAAEAAQPAVDYLKGSWTSLKNGVTNSELWQTISKPFSTVVDQVSAKTATTGLSDLSAGVTTTMDQLGQMVMNYIGDVLRSFGPIGEALVGSAAGGSGLIGETTINPATDQATTTFNPVMNVFGAIMAVYMIYNLIILAVNLLDGCVPEEFEFNTKREMKSCIILDDFDCRQEGPDPLAPMWSWTCVKWAKVGCCFSSPLARIINEQAALQGVGNLNPDGSSCGGLTLPELNSIDWDRMDMTEYINILSVGGKIPEYATKPAGITPSPVNAATQYNSHNATTDFGHAHNNARQRMQQELSFDIDEVREKTNEQFYNGSAATKATFSP